MPDVNQQQQEPLVTPQESIPEPGSEPEGVELDGERFSPEQIREWREAADSRDKWQRSLKQKDMQYAQVRQHLEAAFGKRFGEFDGNDIADLQAFGIFNHKLRTDTGFRDKWQKALVQAQTEEGVPKKEAEARAAQTVQQAVQQAGGTASPGGTVAQAGPDPELQKRIQAIESEYAQRLRRLEDLHIQQQLSSLESHIDQEIHDKIQQHAAELGEDAPEIREAALYRLLAYDDAELIQMARNGELGQIVDEAVKQKAGRIKEAINRSLKTRADEAKRGKTAPAGTVPFKGPAAASAPKPVEEMSIREMHKRMLEELPKL